MISARTMRNIRVDKGDLAIQNGSPPMKNKLLLLVYSAVALLLATAGSAPTAQAQHNRRNDVVARDHHGRNVRRFEYQPCGGRVAHAEHWYRSHDHQHFCPGNLAHGHHDNDEDGEVAGAVIGGILKGLLGGDGD